MPVEPVLYGPGVRRRIPIMQDESIVHAQDLRREVWVRDDKMPLRKKGNGRALHVSDFIVEEYGRLCLSPAQIEAEASIPKEQRLEVFDAREIMYPGKNYGGWWDADHLLAQVKRAVPIFERLYPGCVGEWYFDHSTNHTAYAPDALNAREMNVNPGGQQRVIHDTIIPIDNPHSHLRGKPQQMCFPTTLPSNDPHYKFAGQPKGMKVVLQERGLWDELVRINGGRFVGICSDCKMSEKARDQRAREAAAAQIGPETEDAEWVDDADIDIDPIPRSATCCMQRVLSLQQDFLAEKSMIQVYLEEKGHICRFLPKYHCEFNPIEMYWGWVKRRK